MEALWNKYGENRRDKKSHTRILHWDIVRNPDYYFFNYSVFVLCTVPYTGVN
jgi:hypothetical protein